VEGHWAGVSIAAGVVAFIGGLATYESIVLIIATVGLISGTVALAIAWRALAATKEIQAAQAERIDRLPPLGD
jgi:hypothetical protein